MKKFFKNNKGFTLVELIIVIAVMAVLTVVAAPQYLKYVEKSRIGVDESALGEIAHVAEIEFVEMSVTKAYTDDIVFTVTIADGSIAGKSGDGNTLLATEIAPMCEGISFKSKTYKEAVTVDFTLDPDTGKCTYERVDQGDN